MMSTAFVSHVHFATTSLTGSAGLARASISCTQVHDIRVLKNRGSISYGAEALPALPKATFFGAPVVFASSKTVSGTFGEGLAVQAMAAAKENAALIFDCDGVLCDTERDGHRVSFNEAFKQLGVDAEWDVALYGRLLEIGGGKERMTAYFDEVGWPDAAIEKSGLDRVEFIKELHRLKTDLFMDLIDRGLLPARPGILRIIDEAIAANFHLAVCSTSNERSVTKIMENLFGPERFAAFDEILAGDVVKKKKPNPEIYKLASTKLQIPPSRCIVIEDSRIGLLSAKGAGMNVVITKSHYTKGEPFEEANVVLNSLEDPPTTLDSLAQSLLNLQVR